MKIKRFSFIFAVLFIGAGVSLAGLNATPILNASFESIGDPGSNWGYLIDDWYESENPYWKNYWENGASIGLIGDGTLWAGAEPGGRFYQNVGTVDDGVGYKITALIGDRNGTLFDTASFSLYASTTYAATSAMDGVELSSFATRLSTIRVTTDDGIPTGNPNVWTVTVNLPTGTGHAGEVLWLEFGSVTGKNYFDNIAIAPQTAPPGPPIWNNNPFSTSEGIMGISYISSIANKAIDPNGDAITYSKDAADTSWLTVASDGTLGGTPNVLGSNTFTVIATDIDGSSSATLLIQVKPLGASRAISVNFTDNRSSQQISSNTAAGFGGYINWNNTSFNTGSMGSLGDSDGNVTTASIKWNSKNTWGDNAASADAGRGIGDAQLAYSYLDDGAGYDPCSWTVKGISFARYDVVLYFSTDVPGGSYGPVVINGSHYSTTGIKHRYTNPNWDASNTITVSGLSGDLIVQGYQRTPVYPNVRGSVAGFQIIATTIGDVTPPELNLIGNNPLFVECSEVFIDPGVTALDDFDGDISASIEVSGNVNTQTLGDYVLTYSVSDEAGNSASITRTVTVVDTTPPEVTIESPSSGFLMPVSSSLTVSGSFVDCDTSGSFTAEWVFESSTNLATSFSGTVVGGTVTDSFVVDRAGVYTIRLRVTDASGNTGGESTVLDDLPAYVVVYDPAGGFVTGGGWVWSSPGALHPGLEHLMHVEGKASFGFVSKYKKGSNIPTGQLQFKAGGLNFHSDSYEWLVVSGARAQFKGDGSINGVSGYHFMLTAIDSNVNGGNDTDRFRIKIWDPVVDEVIYDNQFGDEDIEGLNELTNIQAGKIVVHQNQR